jgi:hypothetical protein
LTPTFLAYNKLWESTMIISMHYTPATPACSLLWLTLPVMLILRNRVNKSHPK